MGLSRAERETVISWDDEAQFASVYSASPKTWRKCARLGLEPVKVHHLRDGTDSGRFYRIPVTEFRWGVKSKRRGDAARAARNASRTPKTVLVSVNPRHEK